MIFAEALEALKAGYKVKLSHWSGYWVRGEKDGKDTIEMHCKDGSKPEIRETDDIFYTLGNIVSDEWEVIGNHEDIRIDIYTFMFGEALRRLKAGQKVARIGWNGKGQYIELAKNISYQNQSGNIINCNHESIGNKAIAFVGTSGVQMGWLASQADMLAEDWYEVK